MKYLKLLETLQKYNYYIFSLQDLKNLFPEERIKTLSNQIGFWIKKGYIARLRREVYEFLQKGNSEIPDLYVAGKIYYPSYISLETALSLYGLIPDVAAQVTCVTTKISRKFKNKYGLFIYHTIKQPAYQGYKLIDYSGFKILLAEKEKALVDFVYFLMKHGQKPDFEKLRLNEDILKNNFDWVKAVKYAKLFNTKVVDILRKWQEVQIK